MRLFFALTFSEATKKQITPYRDWVASEAEKGKYTRDANYHLTLEFLGETDPERVPQLKAILQQLAEPPATLRVNRVDSFQKRNKKIIWLGIEQDPAVYQLQQQLISLLREAGFATETRPYNPHITLGRRIVLHKPESEFSFQPFDLPVHAIALMESKREDDKLIYETI
ncbi:RNA 2',3'-cyclic phosphodiesterase [Reinekea marinisedimentorum]|uniref:RNA 2',3'-cyclic phosphodiesterase n=1 Tax=Reinekea marinisedimentorum TaxID=230495 RepID=A0A4R3HSK5_9GAMM|nr:RNA 2',3'-cyclic phosphodiesterase [Reinekea marinisedimentorum]TCS36127.1 2'-5' RNA ligase [Reinekea marinisedimentorum]